MTKLRCPLCDPRDARGDEPPEAPARWLRDHLEDHHRVAYFGERDRLIGDAVRRAARAASGAP